MMANPENRSMVDDLFETNFQSKLASELWLTIAGKDYRLVGKQVKLGRALDNDIILEDKSCSRYHALVSIQGQEVHIQDLKSRNGIKVNDQKVGRAPLTDNTKVEIGDLEGLFFFRKRSKSSATARTMTAMDTEATGAGRQEIEDMQAETKGPSLVERFKNIPPKMRLLVVGAAPLVLFALFILMTSAIRFLSGPSELPQPTIQVADESCSPENRVVEEVANEAFAQCIELEDLGNFRKSKSCLRALPRNEKVCTALERVIGTQKTLAQHRYDAGKKALKYSYFNHAIVNFNEVLLIADEGSTLRKQALEALEDAEKRLLMPR